MRLSSRVRGCVYGGVCNRNALASALPQRTACARTTISVVRMYPLYPDEAVCSRLTGLTCSPCCMGIDRLVHAKLNKPWSIAGKLPNGY